MANDTEIPATVPATVPAAASASASATATHGAEPEDRGERTREVPSAAPAQAVAHGRKDYLRVVCLMNARYHSAREGFLDTVHRWLMFGVVLSGAGAVIPIYAEWTQASFILPLLAATFGTLDLVFDLSNRARSHSLMKRRYFELLADLEEDRKSLTEVDGCLNRYSAEEEPPFQIVLLLSWNAAEETVRGEEAEVYVMPLHRIVSQHLIRYQGTLYPIKKLEEAKKSQKSIFFFPILFMLIGLIIILIVPYAAYVRENLAEMLHILSLLLR